jgi:hypothetical protein
MRRFLVLVLLLPACAHLAQVEQGIRDHSLAGGWTSARGDHMQIGCAGSFSSDITTISVNPPSPISQTSSNARISEVGPKGFSVSRFPLAAVKYKVEEWPHLAASGQTAMRCDGMDWVRTQSLPCD